MGRPIRFEHISHLVNWQCTFTEISVVPFKVWFYVRERTEFIRGESEAVYRRGIMDFDLRT